jgi:raffinose/stachyose/melibiose transport system permease protein
MKNKIIEVIKNIIIGFLAFITVGIPFWLVVVNSFKYTKDANKLELTLPKQWHILANYKEVIIKGEILKGFLNSLLITIVSVAVIVFISSLAAWIFARSKTRKINILYLICLAGVLLPGATITCIKLFKTLNIYGSYAGLIIYYIGIFTSFAIFLITGFIKTIPLELEDAAKIDGCSNYGIFFKIIFPLLNPVLSTLVILLTLFIWNDFYSPLYFLRKTSYYTMPLGLYNFFSVYFKQVKWELVFADVIIVSLPLFILFFFLQKKIISGIMGGALKQ